MPLLSVLQTAPAQGGAATLFSLLPIVLVFIIMYFLILRPQNKKQKETEKMIAALKKGDKVITIGGIHGVVSSTKEKTIIVKVDDNTKIEFTRSAIASVIVDEKAKDKAEKITKAEKEESDSSDKE
ncbi:MAG: preprotein translocase subunit YajC [Treponemataceae bacterium]|nr:preprotein translocase subunit YajC [Treponemataceae bacterium]